MKRALAKLLRRWVDRLDPVSAHHRALRLAKLQSELALLKPSIPDVEPHWVPENAAALRTFLESNHGKILGNRLRYLAAVNAIEGSRRTSDTIHAAGRSAGFEEAVRYVFSLSRVSGVQDTTHDKEKPQDEASLLEQLSP